MAKRETATAVLEPKAPAKRAYRVAFRQLDGQNQPRPHAWLPWGIVVADCASAEEVRAKLHAALDAALYQIEPERT